MEGSAVRAIMVYRDHTPNTIIARTARPFRALIDLLYLAFYLPCFLCRERLKLSPLSRAVLYCARLHVNIDALAAPWFAHAKYNK